jgi:aldehyde dehydrogenase (NAD+)
LVNAIEHVIERRDIFVGGQWVRSAGTDVITVINPATEAPIATIPRGAAEDVDRAAQAAAAAFAAWSQTPVAERAAVFRRIAPPSGPRRPARSRSST